MLHNLASFVVVVTFCAILLSPTSCDSDTSLESESRQQSEQTIIPSKGEDTGSKESVKPEEKKLNSTPIAKYKYLFAQHRATQLEAVKSLVSFGDDRQRYELINVMLNQLFKTLQESRQNLTSWGYFSGDPFPENITILEGVSKVLENTAMFGDMVLRLPDTVHDLYDRQKEWQLILGWAYGFCAESGVFEGPNEQLLNLMAQEVGLIPLQPNYVNPYKAEQPQKMKKFKEPKPKEKKPKKKLKRGPRLSHTEL